MVMDILLLASSLLAIAGVGALAYGYRLSLFSRDPATRYFAWSMALLAASIFWRRVLWDIWHPVVIAGQVDQRPLNILFNAVAIAAAYAGLRARLLLIAPDERGRWSWWSAWAHPDLLCFRADRPVGPHEGRE